MKTRGSASGWVILAVGIALVAAGVWALFHWSSCGRQVQDYPDSLIAAQDSATTLTCRVRLSGLADVLSAYALAHAGRYPPDLNTLVLDGDLPSSYLRCPGLLQQEYLYVAGQTTTANGRNVLVYEAQPDHGGQCHVLLVEGTVQAMTPTQLKAALGRTRLAAAVGAGR